MKIVANLGTSGKRKACLVVPYAGNIIQTKRNLDIFPRNVCTKSISLSISQAFCNEAHDWAVSYGNCIFPLVTKSSVTLAAAFSPPLVKNLSEVL